MEIYERIEDEPLDKPRLILMSERKGGYQPFERKFKMIAIPKSLEEPIKRDLIDCGLNLDEYRISVDVTVTITEKI